MLITNLYELYKHLMVSKLLNPFITSNIPNFTSKDDLFISRIMTKKSKLSHQIPTLSMTTKLHKNMRKIAAFNKAKAKKLKPISSSQSVFNSRSPSVSY